MSGTETRDEAYRSIEHQRPARRQQVVNALAIGPMSNAAIAKRLRLPVHCVTGRVRELVQSGQVRPAYKDVDARTGRRVTVWELIR